MAKGKGKKSRKKRNSKAHALSVKKRSVEAVSRQVDAEKRILMGTNGMGQSAMFSTQGLTPNQIQSYAERLAVQGQPIRYDNHEYEVRRNHVRRSAVDPVDRYMQFCQIDPRNVNVIQNDDADMGIVRMLEATDAEPSVSSELDGFLLSLRSAKIFTLPTWWFTAADKMWRVKLWREFTAEWETPFIGQEIMDLMDYMQDNPALIESNTNEIYDKNWAHNSSIGLPDQMPFTSMFVGLERDQSRVRLNNGHLVYQRLEGQTSVMYEYGFPSYGFVPDRQEAVPLDFIYIDGFLWDMSFTNWNFEHPDTDAKQPGALIWILYSGYVIRDPFCPAESRYQRISMATPVFGSYKCGTPIFKHELEHEVDPSIERCGGLPQTNWMTPNTYVAGPLQSILMAIDEHRVIQSSFSMKQRKKRNRINKENRDRTDGDVDISITHKNYMRVKMSSGAGVSFPKPTIKDESVGLLGKWTLNHRVSIRSHERVKVVRGLKPIREDERKRLFRLGYTLYEDANEMTRKDIQRLKLRNHEGATLTNWVALKAIRVKEHERGPEDAPLVKVVRVADPNTAMGSLRDDLDHTGDFSK